jgi:hypothetical protein
VIDELMGHKSRRQHTAAPEGAAIGRRYRHTTDEMRARVVAAIEARLAVTLEVAGKLLENPASSGGQGGEFDRQGGSERGR